MNNNAFSYLNFIHFSQLNLWDVKRHLLNFDIYNNDNYVLLRDILTNYKVSLNKKDIKQREIHIISKINFSGQLYLRPLEDVDSFKSNLFEIPNESLIYSKINVRHGCTFYNNTGKTIAGTSEYPVFIINKNKVRGEYLQKVLRTSYIKRYLDTKTTGFSKTRVPVDEFLNIKIPLPSLEKQKEIVDRYNAKIKLAEEQEKEAQNLEQEIDQYICETLGIKIQNQLEQNKISYLNFTSLKKLSRWDVYNNKNQVLSTKYNFGKLKDIIMGKPLYGAGEKGINRKTDVRYIRITDINEDGSLNNDVISAENVDKKYLLKENDFLIARSGNTVGKTFLYKEKFGKCIYAGYLIKFTLNLQKIIPEYLLYYTKSTAYKAWINSNQRANAQPNINSNEYLNSPIIIPEIQIQQKLVETISLKKEKIHNLKENSEQNRQLAQEEFEKELFE